MVVFTPFYPINNDTSIIVTGALNINHFLYLFVHEHDLKSK